MSNLMYNGRMQAQHGLFGSARIQMGQQAQRPHMVRRFAGQYAFVMLGPDLDLPGMLTDNPPTAIGSIWDLRVAGGPSVTFVEDEENDWIRGHLVNSEWHGPGDDWRNLTPLTSAANSNHKTVEGYMRNFCHASRLYDESNGYKDSWYGIAYLVQCSLDPFAAQPAMTELYSYAPAFIKVSWRAIEIPKPNMQAQSIQAYLDNNNVGLTPVQQLPFTPPDRPQPIDGPCIPDTNAPGSGAVYNFPFQYPAAEDNGFDGDIEVHQA